jgi:hypothetical protein
MHTTVHRLDTVVEALRIVIVIVIVGVGVVVNNDQVDGSNIQNDHALACAMP